MVDFIWDIYQQVKIADAQKTSDRAVATAQRAQTEASSVDAKVDRLALICCAMWELLRDHTNLTDNDLANKMKEIDLRDGIANGKIGVAPIACAACGNTISSGDAVCIYCGKDNAKRSKISFP